jgi:hypothetical protein
MSISVNLEAVVRLAEQLSDDERSELVVRLLAQRRSRELTSRERAAIFDSMSVDLGEVLPGYSDQRDDWYADGR